MTRAERPRIDVPAPAADRPVFARVGAVAALGFVIGMVWPRLAGKQFVPAAPVDTSEPVATASAAPPPPPAATAPADPPPAAAVAPAAAPGGAKVGTLVITSCRSQDGKKVDDCGALDLSATLIPKLSELDACDGARGAAGTLSLGLELDFTSGQIASVSRGRSTTLPEATATSLIDCAKSRLDGFSLAGIQHPHARYSAFFPIEFSPVAEAAPSAGDKDLGTAASGMATVTWPVALIRASPSKDAKEVSRVLTGTRVVVTAHRGDWYKVKFDAKGNEGWVYKSAIGL